MNGLLFDNQCPVLPIDLGRADVACFVGLARFVGGATIPSTVQDWLKSQGWLNPRQNGGRNIAQLEDVPVPVENYAGFTAMFADASTGNGTDYLAATVRTFFAQGAKRCYVVRVGDPLPAVPPTDPTGLKQYNQAKKAALQAVQIGNDHQSSDPATWHGIGHLAGLTDVSFLLTPDLPLLSASQPSKTLGAMPNPPSGPEQFVECSNADLTPQTFVTNTLSAPRLSSGDYGAWAGYVQNIVQYLSGGVNGSEPHLREIQFVAAFPLPQDVDIATAQVNPSSAALAQDIHNVIRQYLPETTAPSSLPPNLSTAFLQLAYPWLKTAPSPALLESLEPPDGALAGLLARNALKRGAFTCAIKTTPSEIYDVYPTLPARETRVPTAPLTWGDNSFKPLIERLSLFGFTPAGMNLLSDVTTYPGEDYRSAAVNRLVMVICRAARRMGEHAMFEQNGPALWGRVQRTLQRLMTRLWTLNALEGATVQKAFSVRCDESTMTQNARDNGQSVAIVTFTVAGTIELIRITLALQTGSASAQEVASAFAEVG